MGLLKKIKKGVKKVGKIVQKAAPALGFIPGVGTLAAATIGGLGGLASGGLKGALKGAAGGALGGWASGAIGAAGGGAGGIMGGLKSMGSSALKLAGGGGLNNMVKLGGNILGGVSALKQAENAGDIREEANPFGQYRPQFGEQLATNMADPNAFENDPAYKFIRDQGLEAVSRKMASGGYNGSGNMATELANYGGNIAATYRGGEMDRLAHLAGAGIQPASRASATGAQDSSFLQLSGLLKSLGYDAEEEDELAPVAGAGRKINRGALALAG